MQSIEDLIKQSSQQSSGPSGDGGFFIADNFLKQEIDAAKVEKSDIPDLGTQKENPDETEKEEEKKEKNDDEDLDPFAAAEFAEMIVTTEDLLQKHLFKKWHFNSMFQEYEKDRLAELLYDRKIKPEDLQKYDHLLLMRKKEHDEYVTDLPFTETETGKLIKRWKAFLQNKNIALSPGWALVLQTSVIMVPRALPMIVNLFEKKPVEKKPEEKEVPGFKVIKNEEKISEHLKNETEAQ